MINYAKICAPVTYVIITYQFHLQKILPCVQSLRQLPLASGVQYVHVCRVGTREINHYGGVES